jgi:hypothetical protein
VWRATTRSCKYLQSTMTFNKANPQNESSGTPASARSTVASSEGFSYVRIVSFQVEGPEMALRARTKTFPLGSKVTFPFGNMTPALREVARLPLAIA